MIGHLLFLLLRLPSHQVSYNHEGDCEGKMGVVAKKLCTYVFLVMLQF